jgi:hypothetical protein
MRDMVFKERNGKLYASVKSLGSTKEPTAAQAAHRDRFRRAVEYGKLVMSDDMLRALYESAATAKGESVFTLCIADYMRAPTVDSIDLNSYTGKVGDTITITARDDFGVAKVSVGITDLNTGESIEDGWAIPAGSGRWRYTATKAAAPGTNAVVQVTAVDNPGGTGTLSSAKTI